MPWDAIGACSGLIVAIFTGWNVYISLKIRAELEHQKVWCLETFVLRGDTNAARRQAEQWRQSMERVISL